MGLKYISAGEYCATSWQIRRHTQSNESYLFDWLVTTDANFNFLVKDDLNFLKPCGVRLVDGGISLLCDASGLLFQHDFATLPDNSALIDPDKVLNQLEAVRSKFLYLKRKTHDFISGNDLVVVRAENSICDINSARDRIRQLKQVFSALNTRTRFIFASTEIACEEVASDYMIIQLNAASSNMGDIAWRGDNHSWDRLFNLAEKNWSV